MTKKELAKHNKIDDIWLSIRGRVYNVTEYIPFHPGGPEELMRAAGIDATSLFDQVLPQKKTLNMRLKIIYLCLYLS